MAERTVIDALSLNISANATKAITSLTQISTALKDIKNSAMGVQDTSDSIRSLTNSLASLATTEKTLKNTASSMRKLANIDVSKTKDAFETLGRSINSSLGSLANVKESGITQFINSVSRLSKVEDITKATGAITEVGSAINRSFGNMEKIDSSIVKLVSAIARLASAGDKVKAAAQGFAGASGMTEQMRNMIASMQQMGGVPQSINAFVAALAKLGSTGKGITETANALPALCSSLMQFMATMQNAPQVSESTLRMTEAISHMSNSAKSAKVSINNSVGGMNNTFTKLINTLKKVTNSIESLFKKLVSSIAKVAGTIKQHVTDITNSVKQTSSVADGIKTIIGGYLGIQGLRRAFDWTKDAVKSGADLAEINHIVERTFGEDSEAIKAWATTAMDQYGIAENNAKHYAGTLSAMFQASGVSRKDTAKMATDLVGVAGDLSSFYNIDTATAYEKVQAAMAGMVRPLRELGIDMSVASLEQFRLSQGIETAYSQMSQADKTLLRYQYLMHVTSMQQGDFAQTSLSAANSMRIFKAYASAITQTIGDGLVSALRYAVWWLDKVMKYLLAAAKSFQTFMHTLFGANISGGGGAILPDVGQMGIDEGAADAENLSNGLGSAADNAKKLGKNLSVLPFDELNQLQKKEEALASGSGNALGALGNIGSLNLDIGEIEGINSSKYEEAINLFAKRIKSAFENHNWYKMGSLVAEGINNGVSKLKKYLDPNGEAVKKVVAWCGAVGDTLRGFVDTISTYNIGAVIGEMITTLTRGFNEFYRRFGGKEGFRNLGQKLADGVNGILDYVDWDAFGHALGNGIMVAWNIFQGFVHRLRWEDVGHDLATLVNGFFTEFSLSDVMDTIATAINGMFTAIGEFADTLDWDTIGQNIVDGVNTFIDEFDGINNGKKFNKFLSKFTQTFVKVMEGIKWEQLGKDIGDFISTVEWGDAFEKLAGSILEALLKTLKGLISTPGGAFCVGLAAAFELVKLTLTLGGIALSFGTALSGASFISTVGGGLTTGLGGAAAMALPIFGAALIHGINDIMHNAFEDGGYKKVKDFFVEYMGLDENTSKKATTAIGAWWDGLESPIDKFVRKYNKNFWKLITGQETLKEAGQDMLSMGKSGIGTLGTVFDSTQKKLREASKTANSVSEEVAKWKKQLEDGTTGAKSAVTGATTGISQAFDKLASNSSKNSTATADSVKNMNTTAKAEMQKMLESIVNTETETKRHTGIGGHFDSTKNTIQRASGGIFDVLRRLTSNTGKESTSISNAFAKMNSNTSSRLSDMNSSVNKKFNGTGGIIQKIQKAASTIKSAFNFRWSLPDLKLPHISVGRYIKVPVLGTIPDPKTIKVNWYEKGGLFKGGKGQMIGIAENGKDEAVLPLENQRSMARIAKAIVQSGGFNSREFAETVADGVAQAIMSTQNNQPIIVESTLKIENDEVLARSVERGKQKLNKRYSY